MKRLWERVDKRVRMASAILAFVAAVGGASLWVLNTYSNFQHQQQTSIQHISGDDARDAEQDRKLILVDQRLIRIESKLDLLIDLNKQRFGMSNTGAGVVSRYDR